LYSPPLCRGPSVLALVHVFVRLRCHHTCGDTVTTRVVVTAVNFGTIELFLVFRKETLFFFSERHIGSGMSVRLLVAILSGIDLFDQRLQL